MTTLTQLTKDLGIGKGTLYKTLGDLGITKDLGIGKGTLYKTLGDLGITPHQQGRKRVLDDAQVQRIQSAIVSASDSRPSETVNRQTRDARTDDSNIINVLQEQIAHLKILLDSEKSEKSQLLDQVNQSQQLMLAMQTETMRLRSENQKLMLEYQTAPTVQTAEKSKDIIEEVVDQVDPMIAETAKSSGWTWPVLMIGILAVGSWIVLQISPESQLRITELVRW